MLLAQTAVEDGLAEPASTKVPVNCRCCIFCRATQNALMNVNMRASTHTTDACRRLVLPRRLFACSNGLFDSGANPIRFGFP
jgi:hypothetical protein